MKEITVRTIVAEYLRSHGYDGLFSNQCGCRLGDLMPCANDNWGSDDHMADCQPGCIQAVDADGWEGVEQALVPCQDEIEYDESGWQPAGTLPQPHNTVLVAVWDDELLEPIVYFGEWIPKCGWLLERGFGSSAPDPYEEVRYWMYIPDTPRDDDDSPAVQEDAPETGPEFAR